VEERTAEEEEVGVEAVLEVGRETTAIAIRTMIVDTLLLRGAMIADQIVADLPRLAEDLLRPVVAPTLALILQVALDLHLANAPVTIPDLALILVPAVHLVDVRIKEIKKVKVEVDHLAGKGKLLPKEMEKRN